jgi:hypothetical protein
MKVELQIKRLSIIKYVFNLGLEQSFLSESIAFTSILSFHDSVEMLLKLLAEENDKKESYEFMKYWDLIPFLSHREAMNRLNEVRKSLKHKAILPSNSEIESCRVNVSDFLEQTVRNYFNHEFSEISLINLIENDEVKMFLKKVEENIASENFKLALDNCAIAFHQLLRCYKFRPNRKRISYSPTPFFDDNKKQHVNDLKQIVGEANKIFDYFESQLDIISLGLDMRKYTKFKILTPDVYYQLSNKEFRITTSTKAIFNKENVRFCFDFIINSAITVQATEINIEKLVTDELYFRF